MHGTRGPNSCERTERSRLDVILDKLNDEYGEVLDTVEGGGLSNSMLRRRSAGGKASRPSGTGCH